MSKIENIKVYYQLLIVIYLVHTFLFWKLFHFMGALCSKKKDNKQKYSLSNNQSPNSCFLGPTLLTKSGEISSSEAFSAPILAIYFSGEWCPACRTFTPILTKNYKLWNEKEKKIEVVFITGDRDEKSFKQYFGKMPWLALPYSSTDINEELEKQYDIQGIPCLLIVDKKGKILKKDARDDVQGKGEGALAIFEELCKV